MIRFRPCASALLVGACLLLAAATAHSSPIRPLAQDHIVVFESPDAATIPLYNPSIIRHESGRLVAAYLVSGKHNPDVSSRTHIVTSDDGGLTWQKRAEANIGQSRLFPAGRHLYLIGTAGGLRVQRSFDAGLTWSEPSLIAPGRWHQTASNHWHANGHVYLALEKRVGRDITGWQVGDLAPVLLRARATDDLARPESWTFSSDLVFKDLILGYTENKPAFDFVGIPFFTQAYPERNDLAPRRSMSPMGWLEANVAQITDPDHYWFDPSGNTFHLLMRAHTGGTGYAALAKVVENDDGTMTTSLETAPSGQRVLFLPMPGGQMRFHILHDSVSGLYWLLGSQATDSMTRAELLPRERFGTPDNERHRMVLHFSKNLVDWCFAGVVAIGASPKEARHYAAMDFDGDDLVILSRSGDSRARSAHDGNLITFHRVINFRDLVY